MLWAWLMGLVAMTAGAQGVAKKLPELKESAYTHWVGTWATAQQPVVKSFMPYNNNMSNRSVRQIVKVSIGGTMLRLQLSNELSAEPVVIKSVYIAHSKDSFAIDARSAKYLRFGKNLGVTIAPGKTATSDALVFDLRPLERLAVTINYVSAPALPTVHMGSRTTSYIMRGVTTAHTDFSTAFRENHWFNIAAIDVFDLTASAVAIIGNSITDGKNSTDNRHNRWPDMMSEYLQTKLGVTGMGVLNLGIGNNRVATPGGFGTMARERFDRDILAQSGVSAVVIFEGVNDIGGARGNSETVARQLIEAYEEMIRKARAHRLKVFLGTITPFKGAGYYSRFHEAARLSVNDWIKAQKGKVDGILDFDELLRDPAAPEQMRKELQSDWLHPNPEGYRLMGEYAAEKVK